MSSKITLIGKTHQRCLNSYKHKRRLKMSLNYKPSKYTYYFFDEDNNMFMYNFLIGKRSLCIVPQDKQTKVLSIIKSENIFEYNNMSNELLNILYIKGFIINIEENELLKLQDLYMSKVMDNRLAITILPTEQCNFRCPYCYEDHKKGTMSKETQIGLLKFIQKNISKYDSLHVGWFGGEPLIALEVVQFLSENMMKICENNNKVYSSNMTTNGYNLNLDTFKKLYKLKVFSYQITLDGLEDKHNLQRYLCDGSPTFKKIVKNLLEISNELEKVKSNANIMIRTNFSKDNIVNLNELIKFYGENFAKSKLFTFLFRSVGNYGGNTINLMQGKMIKDYNLKKVYEMAYNSKYNFNFANQMRMFEPGGLMCYASKKNTYVIGSDGNIYKCTCDFEGGLIGNVEKNGVLQLDDYKHIRWYTKSLNILMEKCSDCKVAPSCLASSCPRKLINNDLECKNVFNEENFQLLLKCENKQKPFFVI